MQNPLLLAPERLDLGTGDVVASTAVMFTILG
jgi:hypothetical protein